jgi:hypothetical protein
VIIAMSPEEWDRIRSIEPEFDKPDEYERGGVVQSATEEETFQAWSARQIDKLSVAYTELERRVGQKSNRIVQLENQGAAFAERLDGMVPYVELAERVRQLENQPEKGGRILERITALENGSRLVGTGQLIDDFMRRLNKLDNPPTGIEVNEAGVSQMVGSAHRDQARQSSLELAEGRIRGYMTGHFSEGTIGGVVDALWGRKAQIIPIRDHVYQGGNQIGDTCNFNYVVEGEGWPGYRCAIPEHHHWAADDVRRG